MTEAKEKGFVHEKIEFHNIIESAKTIPVGRFIPYEFSKSYEND